MKLDTQLKQDSGYAWVMSKLETVSPFGHARVREPEWYGPGRENELSAELARVECAMAWGNAHVDALIHCLSEFRDIRNSFQRVSNAPMDVVELFEVKHFLLRLDRLAEQYQSAPLAEIELTAMDDMLSLLDPEGRRLPTFSVESSFDPALERIRDKKAQVEQQLREGQNEALMARRKELVQEEAIAEREARLRLTTVLLREKMRFFAAMDALGRLDLVLAKAKLARKYGCVKPEIGSKSAVVIESMTHPQVAEHLSGEFTPVDLELVQGATVVTGANMGGKSVSLKAVALNLLLMHTGFFVFAKRIRSPLFDSVGLIGADGQSVERGLSSFGAEVKALDEVLKQEKGQFFFLALDEFARGTNPREGAALARALVKHLNGLDCVAMLSTHYDGVASAARRHYQVAGLAELERGTLEDLPRLMDYRLILTNPDAPCPQDAMKVCRLLGLDENLMRSFEENS